MTPQSSSEEIQWSLASQERPCPVCGSTQGPCSASTELTFIACVRVPSDWRLSTGLWLHDISSFQLGAKVA